MGDGTHTIDSAGRENARKVLSGRVAKSGALRFGVVAGPSGNEPGHCGRERQV